MRLVPRRRLSRLDHPPALPTATAFAAAAAAAIAALFTAAAAAAATAALFTAGRAAAIPFTAAANVSGRLGVRARPRAYREPLLHVRLRHD
jgi:hypothetical protein